MPEPRPHSTASIHKTLVLLVTALILSLITALSVGAYSLSFTELSQALLSHTNNLPVSEPAHTIVWQLRMPRILAACLVGASLSTAGAIYQGLLRNPLVSPDILGVSAGAGLGAVLAFFLGLSLFWLQTLAFIGGLLAVSLVYIISHAVRQRDPTLIMVLTGIAVSTVLGAAISLIKILADPYAQLPGIIYWLMGSLNSVRYAELAWTAPIILLTLVPVWLLRWRMDILSLSDSEAITLGINLKPMRTVLILLATLMTASAVSFTGIIGWVGLVIPHIARIWVGATFARLLPVSILLGATFVLITDTLARSLTSAELPIGILTALVGGPFFVYVLLSRSQ